MDQLRDFINEGRKQHGLVKLNESKIKVGDKVKYPKSKLVAVVDKVKKGSAPEREVEFTWEDGKKGSDFEGSLILVEQASINEGKYDKKVDSAIDEFDFTGIDIDEYKKLANKSSSADDFTKKLVKYHEDNDENIDYDETMDFAKAVFESVEELNEGSTSTGSDVVISHLVKVIGDAIQGFAGKNGSNDPKHPNASKVNKYLRTALKEIKMAKKEMTDTSDIWLKSVVLKESTVFDNLNESVMSNINLLAQEASDLDDFIAKVKKEYPKFRLTDKQFAELYQKNESDH
jgi:hypothetical protein